MSRFLFELKEGVIISSKAILANKARSVLTTLGIIIGIWAVITMSTAIKGIDIAFQEGVASLGSDNIFIDKWEWFNNDIPWWELRNRRNIDMEDFRRYKDLAKLPIAVAPSTTTTQTVKQRDRTVEYISILGTTDEYIETTNLSFYEGRFFNELESKGGRGVAVLGWEIYESLFPNGGAIGSEVKVKGRKLKVVGVLEEQGSWVMGDWNPDNRIFIPIEFMSKYLQRQARRSITINARAANSQEVDNVKEEAIGIMRRVRGLTYDEENDFSINQQEGLLSNINQTVGVIQIAGYFITGLALFVGAIGIMNIMFVSVKERTREIGIRKAIGAKRRAILGQFLSEAATICLLGGLIGLGIAALTSLIIDRFLPTAIQIEAVFLAIGISLLTGVLSGFAPAYAASKLDPVDSLRYE
ncbi:MAG: ABC transporter permease [Ignavibacteria bacterium]|jgi:putative ABC transport system permease protein